MNVCIRVAPTVPSAKRNRCVQRPASSGGCSDALKFFLLADGVGSDITLTGLGQFIDDAVFERPLGLVRALLCTLGQVGYGEVKTTGGLGVHCLWL